MRACTPKPGFVLLLVLMVLVIAGTILAATARRCLRSAVQAGEAQEELQRRWGALSCRAAVLPQAEQLLKDSGPPQGPGAIEMQQPVVLGGITFDLIVSDEQAKANVNLLARQRGAFGLANCLGRLQEGGPRLPVHLLPLRRRQPARTEADDAPLPVEYASLEQVLALGSPANWLGPLDGDRAPLRRRMTCWGDGKLNLCRADAAALREVLADNVNESQLVKLEDMRREKPDLKSKEILAGLQLTDEQLQAVMPNVTDESGCHSLWVIAEGGVRTWYWLYVQQRSPDSEGRQTWTFAW